MMTSRSLTSLGWLALLSLAAAACSPEVETKPGCAKGAPCDVCPTEIPAEGSSCDAVGVRCPFRELDCDAVTSTAVCASSGWTIEFQDANCCVGEPCVCAGTCIECPASLPAQGDFCDPSLSEVPCPFDVPTPCGTRTANATCSGAQTWEVTMPGCATMDTCKPHAASGACSADPQCRWLAPGCGAAPAPEGCYPIDDCAEGTSCGNGGGCVQASADPCWAGDCNVCSADVFICVAVPG